MSECTHDCSTCGESCSERQEPQSLLKEHHPEAHIGKVFGIVSGKGGVGKSMVTSQLAVTMLRRGHQAFWMPTSPVPPSPRPSASTARPQAARRACIPWCPKPAFR